MTELDRFRFAAMFSADTYLQVFAGATAFFNGNLHQQSYTFEIDHLEWIDRKNFFIKVIGQETSDVIPGEAEGHLGEVVGSEREELGRFCDLVSCQTGPGNLDHGPDHVRNFL